MLEDCARLAPLPSLSPASGQRPAASGENTTLTIQGVLDDALDDSLVMSVSDKQLRALCRSLFSIQP
ncbi:MAG TPA: hypothetical protein VLC92_20050 [Rhodocyclaceae bacterium]|nr:hypothetical protein [Rhodocyclaceae bacterium]